MDGMFNGASGIDITGGTFTITNNYGSTHVVGTQNLYQKSLPEAFYDYGRRRSAFHAPREIEHAALEAMEWANNRDHDSRHILYIVGQADKQNSWIAHKVSTLFQQKGLLGATFFCRPVEKWNEAAWLAKVVQTFFPTLAYQLAASHPDERGFQAIRDLAANNPSILDKSLSTQLQHLIVEPLSSVTNPIVIVIDGIDMVTPSEELQHQILEMLRIPHILFIITSRTTCQWIQDGLDMNDVQFYEISSQYERRNNLGPGLMLRRLAKLAMGVGRGALSCLRPLLSG